MCAEQTRLPAIFEDDDEYAGQLLRGIRLKFDDKVWTAADGTPIAETDHYLVVGTKRALQSWEDGLPKVIDAIPLPDLDELNASVPRENWPISKFTGQPEKPWKHVRA